MIISDPQPLAVVCTACRTIWTRRPSKVPANMRWLPQCDCEESFARVIRDETALNTARALAAHRSDDPLNLHDLANALGDVGLVLRSIGEHYLELGHDADSIGETILLNAEPNLKGNNADIQPQDTEEPRAGQET